MSLGGEHASSLAELTHPVGGEATSFVAPGNLDHIAESAENAAFFDAVLRFNLLLSGDLHVSWVATLGLGLHQATAGESVVRVDDPPFWVRQASAACLKTFDLDTQFDFDFSDVGKRLALLPIDIYRSAARCVFAVLVRDQIRRCVQREEVQRCRDYLGSIAYQAALQWQEHVPSGPWRRIVWADVDEASLQRFELGLMFAVLPPAVPGVRQRLRLKLPQSSSLAKVQEVLGTELERTALIQVFCSVVRQYFPTYQWLLALSATTALPTASMEVI